MRLSKFVSAAMIVGALGSGAIGPGGAVDECVGATVGR